MAKTDWKESALKRKDARRCKDEEEPRWAGKKKKKKYRPWVLYCKPKPDSRWVKRGLENPEWERFKAYIKEAHAQEVKTNKEKDWFFSSYEWKIEFEE